MTSHLLPVSSFECPHPDPEFFCSENHPDSVSPLADTYLVAFWQSYLEFMRAREHDSRSHLSYFSDIESLKKPTPCFCYQYFGCLYLSNASSGGAFLSTDYPFRTDFPLFNNESLTGKARLRALKMRMNSESYLKALLLTQGLNAMNSYSFSENARKKAETIPGFGIFAESTIESGEWIGTFSGGQLLSSSQVLESQPRSTQYRLHSTLFYHPNLQLVLDARLTNTPCRWMRRSCHPNAELKGVFVSQPSFDKCIAEQLSSFPESHVRTDSNRSRSLTESMEHARPDFYLAIYATDSIPKGFEITLPFETESSPSLFKYPCYCGLTAEDCLAPNPFRGLSWSDLVFDTQTSPDVATATSQAYEADPEARRLLLETLSLTLGPPSFPAYMTNTVAAMSSFPGSLNSSTSDTSPHSSSATDVSVTKSSSLKGPKSSFLFSSGSSLTKKKVTLTTASNAVAGASGAKTQWSLSSRLASVKGTASTKLKPLPLKAPVITMKKPATRDRSWKASAPIAKVKAVVASPASLSPTRPKPQSQPQPDLEPPLEEPPSVEPTLKKNLSQLSREERKLQMYIESIERNEARERKKQQEKLHRESHLQSATTSAASSTSSSPKRKKIKAEPVGPLPDFSHDQADDVHGKSSEPDSSPIRVKSLLSTETLFDSPEPSMEESAEKIEILAEEPLAVVPLEMASHESELKPDALFLMSDIVPLEEIKKEEEEVQIETEPCFVKKEPSPSTEDDMVDIE